MVMHRAQMPALEEFTGVNSTMQTIISSGSMNSSDARQLYMKKLDAQGSVA